MTRAGQSRSEGEGFLDDGGQALRDGAGLVLGRRFDHDPDERLGTRRPQQHAAGVTQFGFGAGDRRLKGRLPTRRGTCLRRTR